MFLFFSRVTGGRGRARVVGARRRDPVRHGRAAAVHATVRSQLATGWQDHQADADKRHCRHAGKGESLSHVPGNGSRQFEPERVKNNPTADRKRLLKPYVKNACKYVS